jgi:hypothetical protein
VLRAGRRLGASIPACASGGHERRGHAHRRSHPRRRLPGRR